MDEPTTPMSDRSIAKGEATGMRAIRKHGLRADATIIREQRESARDRA
jgi:hypothetical protein